MQSSSKVLLGLDDSFKVDTFRGRTGSFWKTKADREKGKDDSFYDPSDPEVECFGLELAIAKRDVSIFKYLWSEYSECWDERHFSFLFTKMLKEQWEMGISLLFRSKTSDFIFNALKSDEKDNFIGVKILDKLQDHDFWAT